MGTRRTTAVALALLMMGLAVSPEATLVQTPRPDLSGLWMIRYRGFPDTGAPMTPWAQALMTARAAEDDPGAKCLPPGVPRGMGAPYPMEIVQKPTVIYFLHEYHHLPRRVFIGASHPKDLDPNYMGHSIGRWDGDTLVVDTIGLSEETWLAPTGLPHSDQLHVIERVKTSANGKVLEIQTTIDDPKAYVRPWTLTNIYDARPDLQIMEYICQENNRAITK